MFINYNAFSFPCLLCFIFFFAQINEHAVGVKRNTCSIAEEKDFLLSCKEKAMTDLLDKCVTSAGVSGPF